MSCVVVALVGTPVGVQLPAVFQVPVVALQVDCAWTRAGSMSKIAAARVETLREMQEGLFITAHHYT